MAEPISLALFKQHLRVTSDQEDELLAVYLGAARKYAEKHTGRYFVDQVVTKAYPANQNCPIPVASIVSISGFYDTLEAASDAYNYFNEYRKGTIISREYPIDWENLPTYTVRYNVVAEPMPLDILNDILKLAAEFYENREAVVRGVAYQILFADYRAI